MTAVTVFPARGSETHFGAIAVDAMQETRPPRPDEERGQ
jgi:hypothetical protein